MSIELKNKLIENYDDCIDTITNLSKNFHSNQSSINDDKKLFNLDKIVRKVFNGQDVNTSADAMYIANNTITFIEFKGGFHDLINEKTKDSSLIKCPKDENIECDDYVKLFKSKRQKEKENLKCNLICKIIETFIFYKYELLNLINNDDTQNIKLYFFVVINDYLEDYQDILLECADGSTATSSDAENFDNVISTINQLTKRFRNKNGRYYYHNVQACGVTEFKKILAKYSSL